MEPFSFGSRLGMQSVIEDSGTGRGKTFKAVAIDDCR